MSKAYAEYQAGMREWLSREFELGRREVTIEYEAGCGWWSVWKPVPGVSHFLVKDRFSSKESAQSWAVSAGWEPKEAKP